MASLHYISQSTPHLTQLEAIQTACEAGCRWIQLRMKDTDESKIIETAFQAQKICEAFQATLIINDYPNIALAAQADGVHLGLDDFNHTKARQLLGQNYIIGGTANTIEDIRNYAAQGVIDYLGVGPFRFTTTKKKLSPILGIEGYTNIIQQCRQEGISLPIIAIGGIELEDIPALMNTGVHGIAVSGLITHAENKPALVGTIIEMLRPKL
ncbi:MAG: thiamine phosphate synthase [Saprospiraceae bacterium]|nr:thiamine phosphate synthase [Saprospiraceae bacterium]